LAVKILPVAYLEASGAKAISVLEKNGVASILAKARPERDAVVVFWLPGTQVRKVAAKARVIAGKDDLTVDRLVAAIHAAAKEYRTEATPHDTAVRRAAKSIEQLDVTFEQMRKEGQLQVFNQLFARQHEQRHSLGLGYMSYNTALMKLKRALIPVLAQGKDPMATRGLLASVFGLDQSAVQMTRPEDTRI
jgi:hypothetical protein